MNPREQGDLGERAAAVWLLGQGHGVAVPFLNRSDWDLLAEIGDEIVRVQVKTSVAFHKGRWVTAICTRGGNRSWNGVVKRMGAERCDYLFVLVGDGRQWFIPTSEVAGGSGLLLGGPKYAAFEVERGAPVLVGDSPPEHAPLDCPAARGDVRVVKGDAL